MKTPIYDFVENYTRLGTSRFHMPGHKGKSTLGPEPFDITEIDGADVLYSPSGIIKESENNAAELFKSYKTVYSAEGSTLAIKAMLKLAFDRRGADTAPLILAARNVHKSFINACALIGIDIEWIYPKSSGSICSCEVTPKMLRESLLNQAKHPFAVYLTSPDYLGNIADISGISQVCDEFSIPLLVDNAHGAYLAFLEESMHPIALGASMCTDSAHKTLPVLTGGAYLHISEKYSKCASDADAAISLFASTSPSYLILSSLDLCNAYLSGDYRKKLTECIGKISKLKSQLSSLGVNAEESEPLKIVFKTEKFGYTGDEFAEYLRENLIEVEFSDYEYTVLMTTPENTDEDFARLYDALSRLKIKPKTSSESTVVQSKPKKAMTVREAIFAPQEDVNVEEAVGRICALATVSCPPAIPIAVSGEIITESEVELFKHYGIQTVRVVKE